MRIRRGEIFVKTGLIISCCVIFAGLSLASVPDRKEFGKYRLTDGEWELIEDSQISSEKLVDLLESSIRPGEYFSYPWLKTGISEREWVRQRASGILKKTSDLETSMESKQWAVIQSLFFPGLNQFKRKQVWKGLAMSGLALSSVAFYALQHKPGNVFRPWAFDYPQYLIILGIDMLWSSFDIGMQLSKELNPDAQRFTMSKNGEQTTVDYTNTLHFRNETYVQNVSQW